MSSSCIASSRMIWFEMKRWICREGRNSASLLHGLISTLKYREENGSVKEVCFCLGFVWLISEVDALVKKSGLNWILYLFFCKNDFTIKIKLLNVIVIHLSICACVCLCVTRKKDICFSFYSLHKPQTLWSVWALCSNEQNVNQNVLSFNFHRMWIMRDFTKIVVTIEMLRTLYYKLHFLHTSRFNLKFEIHLFKIPLQHFHR